MRKLALFCLAAVLMSVVPGASADRGVYRFEDGQPLANSLFHPLWAAMAGQHEKEMGRLNACLADKAECPHYLRGYRKLIERAAGLDPHAQLVVVNRFFNRRRYVEDRDHPDVEAGQWHTITRFLRVGGDCEDYAIAKYFALRRLGFAAERLRVVVAYDTHERDFHAMLAVNMDGKSHLLETDNTIKRGRRQRVYDVSYAINEHFWWDHVTANGNSRFVKSL